MFELVLGGRASTLCYKLLRCFIIEIKRGNLFSKKNKKLLKKKVKPKKINSKVHQFFAYSCLPHGEGIRKRSCKILSFFTRKIKKMLFMVLVGISVKSKALDIFLIDIASRLSMIINRNRLS
jgi:hypothetical protein